MSFAKWFTGSERRRIISETDMLVRKARASGFLAPREIRALRLNISRASVIASRGRSLARKLSEVEADNADFRILQKELILLLMYPSIESIEAVIGGLEQIRHDAQNDEVGAALIKLIEEVQSDFSDICQLINAIDKPGHRQTLAMRIASQRQRTREGRAMELEAQRLRSSAIGQQIEAAMANIDRTILEPVSKLSEFWEQALAQWIQMQRHETAASTLTAELLKSARLFPFFTRNSSIGDMEAIAKIPAADVSATIRANIQDRLVIPYKNLIRAKIMEKCIVAHYNFGVPETITLKAYQVDFKSWIAIHISYPMQQLSFTLRCSVRIVNPMKGRPLLQVPCAIRELCIGGSQHARVLEDNFPSLLEARPDHDAAPDE